MQPIRRDLADLLRLWLAWKKPGAPVFDMSRWDWHRTARMMREDLAAAGIDYQDASKRFVDFHALRHTYISNIGRLPVSLKTHQELARHSEPSLTMRYTHARLDDKVRALEALPPTNAETGASAKGAVA